LVETEVKLAVEPIEEPLKNIVVEQQTKRLMALL
jgi:hypothetical protein